MSALGKEVVGGLQRTLEEGVVGPLQQRLAFSKTTVRIARPRGTPCMKTAAMTTEGAPPRNLYFVKGRNAPTKPIATIPLKPPPFIRISIRITESSMIVIIGPPPSADRRRPPILSPDRKRLTRPNPK